MRNQLGFSLDVYWSFSRFRERARGVRFLLLYVTMATGHDEIVKMATGQDEDTLLGYRDEKPSDTKSIMTAITSLQSTMNSVATGMTQMGDAWAAIALKSPVKHRRKPPSEKEEGEEDDDDDDDDDSDSGSVDLDYDDGDDVRSLLNSNKSKRGNETKSVSAGENSKKS